MAGIGFMNRDNVRGVIIEGCEPFLFLLRRPVCFHRRDVVISLGCFGFKRPGSVHGRKTGCPEELWRFFNSSSDGGGESNDVMVNHELPDHVEVPGSVGNKTLFCGMIFL